MPTYFSVLVHLVYCIFDARCRIIHSQMPKHIASAKDHGSGICGILSFNVFANVACTLSLISHHSQIFAIAAYGLKHGVFGSDAASRQNTRRAHESGTDVANDVPVQIGSHDDVKLLGLADQLHGSVVHNHIVHGDACTLVLFRHRAARIKEQTITQFPEFRKLLAITTRPYPTYIMLAL